MDYISQIEKLYSYLRLELELSDMRKMLEIKKDFNNDFNLLACFIKDFLTVQTSCTPSDEDIYNDFLLYFEKNKNIDLIKEYSKYYLMIVFEEVEDKRIELALATVNACYALECYPDIMKILYKYYNNIIDDFTMDKMFQHAIDIVLDRFEYPQNFDETFSLEFEIEKRMKNQKKVAI